GNVVPALVGEGRGHRGGAEHGLDGGLVVDARLDRLDEPRLDHMAAHIGGGGAGRKPRAGDQRREGHCLDPAQTCVSEIHERVPYMAAITGGGSAWRRVGLAVPGWKRRSVALRTAPC